MYEYDYVYSLNICVCMNVDKSDIMRPLVCIQARQLSIQLSPFMCAYAATYQTL